MTADRFELDLRAVLREQAPDGAPLTLRLRVAEVAVQPVSAQAPALDRFARLAWVLIAAALLVTLLAATLLIGGARPDRAVVVVRPAPPDAMTTGRVRHTATLLDDGRVLLTGGDLPDEGVVRASAELYDPATGTFSRTDPMTSELRQEHTAIRLADGRVLVIGGTFPLECQLPEIWDPATGRFRVARGDVCSNWTLSVGPLRDGRVLVIYPLHDDLKPDPGRPGSSADLFEPAVRGVLSRTGSLATDRRDDAVATRLPDGRVLVAGGGVAALEVYDVATGAFTTVGWLSGPGSIGAATVLADGRVLILSSAGTSAEIYDPTASTVTSTGPMTTPRAEFTATLLADGHVLVAGGALGGSAELYDPATGTFSRTGSMAVARYGHTATLLEDGTVLIAGGASRPGALRGGQASAELYDPGTAMFRSVGER
jgi:hypothetical protein